MSSMNEYLSVGLVIKPHGVRGQLKVEPLTDDPARFEQIKSVYVEKNGEFSEYQVESCGFMPAIVLLKLKGIDDMSAAESLRGLYLWVPRSQAKPLEENEYYWADLIGLPAVFSDTEKHLGTLVTILETPSNDIYVVKTPKEQEILLPALKQYITVEMEKGRILIHREGLEEILPDED